MAEEARELSRVSFTRTLIQFIRSLPHDLVTSRRPHLCINHDFEVKDFNTWIWGGWRHTNPVYSSRKAKYKSRICIYSCEINHCSFPDGKDPVCGRMIAKTTWYSPSRYVCPLKCSFEAASIKDGICVSILWTGLVSWLDNRKWQKWHCDSFCPRPQVHLHNHSPDLLFDFGTLPLPWE